MKNKKLLTGVLAGIFMTSGLVAQTDSTVVDDFFDMELSLEDLMGMKVESATKSSISIQKAPSVIRVFSADDILNFGFLTLKDILDQVPGTQVQEYRAGHQLTWIRGVQARYNNKVLLLIDGVPMRDSYYGNFLIDDAVPIENIKRVEILNGPGSVLYGANGFSGVISITTKDANDGKEALNAKAEYGSWNQVGGNLEIAQSGVYANVDYHLSDGFSPQYNQDGSTFQHDQTTQNFGFFTKYSNENFTAIGSYSEYNYPYRYRKDGRDEVIDRVPMYAAMNYKKDVGEGTFNVRGYINKYDFRRNETRYNDDKTEVTRRETEFLDTYLYGGEMEYSTKYKEHDLIIGASLQIDEASNMQVIRFEQNGVQVNDSSFMLKPGLEGSVSNSNIGLYVQDVYNITDKYLFTGGLRYNILNNFDNQFNYRLGLTGMFTDNFYGKLLFGTSYRVPSYREYLDKASYNDNLQPEQLRTLEAQIGYVIPKGDINATFYHNVYDNFIQEIIVDSVIEATGTRIVDDEMAFNFDTRTTTGLELYANLRPTNKLFINAGVGIILNASEILGSLDTASIKTSQDLVKGENDIYFLSNYTFNTSASYAIAKRVRAGLRFNYFSKRSVPENYQAGIDPEVQDASLADAFFKVDIFANARVYKGLSVSVNINNVTNNQIFSPPYGGAEDFDAEAPGANFRIAATYKF